MISDYDHVHCVASKGLNKDSDTVSGVISH